MSLLKQTIYSGNSVGIRLEKSAKVKDPPRFPKVIDGYEREATKTFKDEMDSMFVGLTKILVSYAK